jgi:ABC-type multidrug transport system fused ATPase/permease subunit
MGISSIIPLTSAFFNQPISNNFFLMIKDTFPLIEKVNNFSMLLTFFILSIIISNLIFIFSTYLSAKITFAIERDLRNTLYNYFINNNYSFFFKTTSSEFISLMINETQRLCTSVLLPLAEVISRIVLVIGISIFLIFLTTKETTIVIFVIIFFYILYYLLIRKKIIQNNRLLTKNNQDIVKNSNDLFKSFREIKIYGIESFFLNKITDITNKIQKIRFFTVFFSTSPRYYMEIIMFLFIYVFFIFRGQNFNIEQISFLAVFIYTFFKILPSLQGLFSQFMVAKSNLDSLDILYEKFYEFRNSNEKIKKYKTNPNQEKGNFKEVKLKNISFNYDEKKILSKIDINIYKGEKIGIKGKSGSGKTTLINIIVGLTEPSSGEIYFNNHKIKPNELLKRYDNKIGIIPQNPTMLETSVRENILLGEREIKNKFNQSLNIAGLSNFTEKDLDKNIHSSSLNLSGGQIQRISIARAIYRSPDILIIDEGFNQLDNENEKKIMQSLLKIENLTIIMIFHNISNESLLSKIYLLKDQKLKKI